MSTRRSFLLLAAILLCCAALPATTIDFSTLTSSGSLMLSYTENGYLVSFGGASWASSTALGSPAPSVGCTGCAPASFSVQSVTAGTDFTFASLDLNNSSTYSTNLPNETYTITGMLGTTQEFQVTGTLAPSTLYTTVSNVSQYLTTNISQLNVSVTPVGGAGTLLLTDNITLGNASVVSTGTPEPGTYGLFCGGLAAMALRAKRRMAR